MTITVSISEFRKNISGYLSQIKAGKRIVLRDEKKDEDIAEIVGKKRFNTNDYQTMLSRVAGVFKTSKHPEWSTQEKTENWVRKTRKADERDFDVHP